MAPGNTQLLVEKHELMIIKKAANAAFLLPLIHSKNLF